jgi:hypothetical protein
MTNPLEPPNMLDELLALRPGERRPQQAPLPGEVLQRLASYPLSAAGQGHVAAYRTAVAGFGQRQKKLQRELLLNSMRRAQSDVNNAGGTLFLMTGAVRDGKADPMEALADLEQLRELIVSAKGIMAEAPERVEAINAVDDIAAADQFFRTWPTLGGRRGEGIPALAPELQAEIAAIDGERADRQALADAARAERIKQAESLQPGRGSVPPLPV